MVLRSNVTEAFYAEMNEVKTFRCENCPKDLKLSN